MGNTSFQCSMWGWFVSVCVSLLLNLACKPGVHRFSQKYRSHLRILGSGNVTGSIFCAEASQILGATVHNLVARTIWRPKFVYPCCKHLVELPGRGIGPSQSLPVRRKTQKEHTKTCFSDSCGVRSRRPCVGTVVARHIQRSHVSGRRALWSGLCV